METPGPAPLERPAGRPADRPRPLRTALLLSVGSELTAGETRDTNGGDLARSLERHGVTVSRIVALPDRLTAVVAELRAGLRDADLIVTTGGLGPTPDDLTRESIADVVGEAPAVDSGLEGWLRDLFDRRGIAFARTNLKQAWLIPSAAPIPNDRGTAPGWWVDRPDGRLIVALPGPPAEMRPMWEGWVLPRLRDRGLGRERSVRTYRLTGIGESQVAALLGERLLRARNPVVATYARADAVDVRISAHAADAHTAADLVEEAARAVLAAVGGHVWGRDDDTWPDVLARELDARGWQVSLVEVGTGGATIRLLGDTAWLAAASLLPFENAAEVDVAAMAEQVRREARTAVGLAVRAVEAGKDTAIELAASGPWGSHAERRTAFLGGAEGRRRAALAAAAFLHEVLSEPASEAYPEEPRDQRTEQAPTPDNTGARNDSPPGSER